MLTQKKSLIHWGQEKSQKLVQGMIYNSLFVIEK